jgi:mannan endo-1,4-beta-mannosidase
MYLTRRQLIKFLASFSTASLASQLIPVARATSEHLYGINAFYLLTESYRKVQQNPNIDIRKTILKYLQDELGLPALRESSKINAIRFLAGNNYPVGQKKVGKTAFHFDAALWISAKQIDWQVLEILENLAQCLAEMEFYLVPVLYNYWIEYGGILRYLEWSGRLNQEDWFNGYCNKRDEDYYRKYSIDFYTNVETEKLFQNHITPVINSLRNNSRVVIIDVMNEPRGKNQYSESNQVVKDGLYSHQIVSQWLNRQAAFIRKNLPSNLTISTGEEGWLVSPVDLNLNYLKNDSQYYEGIDLKTNLFSKNSALTMGSIHMYTHAATELAKKNSCGNQYIDRRGWDYLLQPNQPQRPESYIKMGEEWLKSRASVFGNKPWYVGEMGWCRSQSSKNLLPLSATALQQERMKIYRDWTKQAFDLGARGVFLWELEGLQHRDEFYGLSRTQVAEIYPN